MSDASAARFCLRDLPIPAKLVVTCFLLAVGLGYTSAMVQLHFQDSKSGAPMPTVADVVVKFTGKKWFDNNPDQPPVSAFVHLITAKEGQPFSGSGTMSPAFFAKSKDFTEAARADRTGERDMLVLWATAPADARRAAYDADKFKPEEAAAPAAITSAFKHADGEVKVKSIIEARCVRCHREDGADPDAGGATSYPLDRYEGLEKYLKVDPARPFREGGDWVKVQEPISLDKLTQSTHAHLLSFAVLFSLTGLTFAFTSYPTSVRCLIGPLALVAIVTDVCFWWLARLSDTYGIYFAMGVIGTGGLAGLGLGAQIVLSLWNMYGPKGKLVILLLFLVGGATMGLVFKQLIIPGLEEKKRLAEQNGQVAKKDAAVMSRLEAVLQLKDAAGKELPVLDVPFKKEPDWNMVRALYDFDNAEFADAKKEKDQAEMKRLMPERDGERLALIAWAKLPDAERKKVFDEDAFALPPGAERATPAYVKNGKLKIATLITDRCVRCHAGDVKDENRFADYDTLKKSKFLDPK
ncbi:MAG TPA: hypothetical protein VM529_02970 [Gemmata sp.]|nr:hypothetical protein [Gemmata sp.]